MALPEWVQAALLGTLAAATIPFIAVGARPFIYFRPELARPINLG